MHLQLDASVGGTKKLDEISLRNLSSAATEDTLRAFRVSQGPNVAFGDMPCPLQKLLLFGMLCALHCNISTSFCTSLPLKTAENHREFLWKESTMVYLLIVKGFSCFFKKTVFKILRSGCLYLCECTCIFIEVVLDVLC